MISQRLDKYLADVTDLSRSQAKRAIKAGRITVDHQPATDAASTITDNMRVYLDGELLRVPGFRYFMLHKPPGYISAAKDRQHLTAIELLQEDNLDKLHIAGRLDIDATGLLLITDDGQWSHRITSPNHHCIKTYYVETALPVSEKMLAKLEEGVYLAEEKQRTRPAQAEVVDNYTVRLSISEGKYHQVKRMFAAVGNKVERLHRERIGAIVLDECLEEGEYRRLTEQEIASVEAD